MTATNRANDIKRVAAKLRDIRIAQWLNAHRLDGSMFALVA